MYEKEVLDTYKQCHITKLPLDCFKVIEGIGYKIETYSGFAKSKDELVFFRKVSPDAFTYFDNKIILYNETLYHRRIRFTLMHEVGHIVLDTYNEDEADTFASEILAPLPVVARYGYFDVDDICRRFDVSVAMANRVVMATKGKTIVDTEGILDYFTKIEDEDWERRNLGTFRRAIPNTYLSCKAPVRKSKVSVKVSSRTNKAILERNEFIRSNPQIEWNDMRLAKRDAESFLW